MLAFVVPIKSRKVAKSWSNTCLLLERTARSICHQTHPDFRMIVVCQERPEIKFEHPKIQYLEMNVDMPVPTTIVEKRVNKMHKIIAGICLAKASGCSHIMVTDGDDCVSKSLAGLVAPNQSVNGYFLKAGYIYYGDHDVIKVMRKGFHHYCGTSHIIKSDLYDVSEKNLARIPSSITSHYQIPQDIHDLYYCHRYFAGALEAKGFKLEPLPFLGSIYVLSNGENLSSEDQHTIEKRKRSSLKSRLLKLKASLFDYRPLTPQLRDEFGFYDLELVNPS